MEHTLEAGSDGVQLRILSREPSEAVGGSELPHVDSVAALPVGGGVLINNRSSLPTAIALSLHQFM